MTGSRIPAGKALRYAGAIAIAVATLFWFGPRTHDRLFWPESAHDRIEGMANILRRIVSPARWCYPSVNSSNIYKFGNAVSERLDECLKHIEPVSDFLEVDPNHYIKRFYRGKTAPYFCEVTLSTVFNDDRLVGSDCYFGLFRDSDDTGIGMTDDPFG